MMFLRSNAHTSPRTPLTDKDSVDATPASFDPNTHQDRSAGDKENACNTNAHTDARSEAVKAKAAKKKKTKTKQNAPTGVGLDACLKSFLAPELLVGDESW
jgi:hypothetical protein